MVSPSLLEQKKTPDDKSGPCSYDVVRFLPLIPSFTVPPPYNKDSVAAGKKTTLDMVELLENHLKDRDYLVGKSISIADIMVGIYLSRLFEWVLDQKWRDNHPAVMGFFDKFTTNEAVQQVIPRSDFILIDEETPNEPSATRQAGSGTDSVA
jgi:elongation factor 1-gamma